VDVALLRWPLEGDRRDDLAASGVPRLLLVEDGMPPTPLDCLEDWVRVPAADDEVQCRVDALTARAGLHRTALPELDEFGMLRFRGRWTSLPPVEARLTGALVERLGAVVSREAMARAGWPAGAPGRNALDVHVLRMRRRVAPLGLVIRTVRSRGYLLEVDGAPEDAHAENGSKTAS
jgi:hypothetical protein